MCLIYIKMKGGYITSPDLQLLIAESYDPNFGSVDGYTIDKALSNTTSKVFVRNGTNDVFVVHRGSKDATDFYDNLKLMSTGRYSSTSSRMNSARSIQTRAEKKYGRENVSTLGHSKGGSYAETLGKNSKEIITLNKPVSATDVFYKVPEKQTDIRTEGDPVSMLRRFQRGKEAVIIKSETSNPLEEHKKTVLERIPDEVFGGAVGGAISGEDMIRLYGRSNLISERLTAFQRLVGTVVDVRPSRFTETRDLYIQRLDALTASVSESRESVREAMGLFREDFIETHRGRAVNTYSPSSAGLSETYSSFIDALDSSTNSYNTLFGLARDSADAMNWVVGNANPRRRGAPKQPTPRGGMVAEEESISDTPMTNDERLTINRGILEEYITEEVEDEGISQNVIHDYTDSIIEHVIESVARTGIGEYPLYYDEDDWVIILDNLFDSTDINISEAILNDMHEGTFDVATALYEWMFYDEDSSGESEIESPHASPTGIDEIDDDPRGMVSGFGLPFSIHRLYN